MIKSFKVRLKLNNKQKSFFNGNANISRFVYNWALARQKQNYQDGGKFINNFDLRKELTILKKSELSWLYNYDVDIAKQAVKDACDSYIKFFKRKSCFPRFKSKKYSKKSFFVDNIKIKITDNGVKIPKLKTIIKFAEKYYIPLNCKYANPRITSDGINWFLSVAVEKENKDIELNKEGLGIDVGLKNLAIRSDGVVHKNINKDKKLIKIRKKLKRFQRNISRKYLKNKVSNRFIKTNNIEKLKIKLKKQYIKINNIQNDYFKKIAIDIARTKPYYIAMEDLNIAGMIKNKNLANSFQNSGLYNFKIAIKNKCIEYGINFIEVDRFFPSSKLCSCCGMKKENLKLKDRIFHCNNCGFNICRDLNASINLKQYPELQGNLSLWSVKPKESSCKTKSDTMKKENSKKLTIL